MAIGKVLPNMPLMPRRHIVPVYIEDEHAPGISAPMQIGCRRAPHCLTTGLYDAPIIIKELGGQFILLGEPKPDAVSAWSLAGLGDLVVISDAESNKQSWAAAARQVDIDVTCGLQKNSLATGLYGEFKIESTPELTVGASSLIPADDNVGMLDADGNLFVVRTIDVGSFVPLDETDVLYDGDGRKFIIARSDE